MQAVPKEQQHFEEPARHTATASGARTWLRCEGLVVLIGSVLLYHDLGRGWLLFALLFLTPDLSMLGYLAGNRAGARAYNLFHTYAASLLLALYGYASSSAMAVTVALIWTAHIGFDRLLGYGLKLPSDFKDTHLGRIGLRGQ